MTNDKQFIAWRRWRLALGKEAEIKQQSKKGQKRFQLSETDIKRDASLDYLYGENADSPLSRAGQESTRITPVTWLAETRKVFPKSTVNFLQNEAIQRFNMKALLCDPEVLKESTASVDLVATLISFRHQLPENVMTQVRAIIQEVCRDIEEKLAKKVQTLFSCRRLRHLHGGHKQFNNLDWAKTLRQNLKHYQKDEDTLILENLFFYKNQSQRLPWHVYVVVDQSASMTHNIIHASVLASIFYKVRSLSTHLILFDTSIVDLTDQLDDPVETLLAVQLGGGTDIAAAMRYTADKIQQSNRSIVILISDFYEGGSEESLLATVEQLRDSQVKMLGLAALDQSVEMAFDQDLAKQLTDRSMPVSAMTPDHLAEWIAKEVGS